MLPSTTKPASSKGGRLFQGGLLYVVMLVIIFLSGLLVGNLWQELQHKSSLRGLQPLPVQQPQSQASTSSSSLQQAAAPPGLAPSNRTMRSSDLSSLSRLNALIQSDHLDVERCQPQEFGKGWGNHHLCTKNRPAQPCHFYSFGVSKDYSFDVAVAETWGCTGFAADPTIIHNSTLHPGVTFHNVAANSPWVASSASAKNWISTSIPALRKWLRHDRIAVLKMDCEGCEYSLASDVLSEDPDFFKHVDQVAFEIHWSRMWMRSENEMYALATLLDLLEEAKLQLVHVNLTPCGAFAANTGLLPELKPYMGVLFQDGPQQHCHNYLFARL